MLILLMLFLLFVAIFLIVDSMDSKREIKTVDPAKIGEKLASVGLIHLSFYAIISLILFSVLGLTINLFLNYKAVLFQFGEATRVDSDVLADYLFIRNLFMGVGLSLGGLYGLIKFHHKQLSLLKDRSNLK